MVQSHRTLLVEPDPARRRWMAAGLGPRAGQVVEVPHGWEALIGLADQAWNLLVVGPQVRDPPPVPFAAMLRTVGLATPVLIVLPFPDAQTAKAARRLRPVEVVDDWTNGVALRAACEALIRRPPDRSRRSAADSARLLMR